MILGFTTLLVLAQSAPALPAGVDPSFQAAVLKVEQQLEAGKFADAQTSLASFPKLAIGFAWDDANVAPADRAMFGKLRAAAFDPWQRFIPGLTFTPNAKGALRINFARENPLNPDTRFVTPVVFQRKGGALTATISLVRGSSGSTAPATESDIQKSITQSVGTYLGVTPLPYAQTAMSRAEASITRPIGLIQFEGVIAGENIKVVDALRKFASSKTKVVATSAKVSMPKSLYQLGSVYQGAEKEFEVEVVNSGTGKAKFWIRPDCGCIVAPGIIEIAPKSKVMVPIKFTSDEFSGKNRKHLYLISNDSTKPIGQFEFEVQIDFAYQFISPSGSNVVIVDENSHSSELYLVFNGINPMDIRTMSVSGVPVEVRYESWAGNLADRAHDEPARGRTGYRILLSYPDSLPPGRTNSTVVVQTDDPTWPVLRYDFGLQKGIVALPDNLYMGQLPQAKKAKLLISRPGKPFKIVKVESDSPYFSVEIAEGGKPDEHVLDVSYNGNAPTGSLNKTLTVTTDDPKQPTIRVPVRGRVP